jgi:hypothetical protein
MAVDLSTLTVYPWSQLKAAASVAIGTALMGGNSLTISGRVVARVTPEEARAIYDWACEMEALESAGTSGGGNVLVRFGQPQ